MKRNSFTLANASAEALLPSISPITWMQRIFAFVVISLLITNTASASKEKVNGLTVGAQNTASTYGSASSPTYGITLAESSVGGSQAQDKFTIAWTGGTPNGVTSSIGIGFNYTPNGNNQVVTITINTSASTPAGTYTFTITNTENNGGVNSSNTGTLIVSPKALTITGLTASNKVYDGTTGATTAGSATLNGVVNGDIVTLGGSANATFASASAGNGKSVTVTGYSIGGAGASNYTLTQPSGLTANITAAPLSVSGLSAANKIYDGTTAATVSGTATFTGLIASDNGKVGYSTAGTFASANAGNNIGVTVVLTGTAAANYTLTQPGLTANISQALLSITANNVSKIYGSALTVTSGSTAFSSSGLKGSETIGSVTITYGTGAAATASVGAYSGSVTPSSATGGTFNAGNYSISYIGGNISVNAASLTITAFGATKTYGTALPATAVTGSTAFSATGLKNGETIGSVTISYFQGTGSGAPANAGVINSPYNNQVTPSAPTGGTFSAGNYNITYTTGAINVTAANMTITANGPLRNYGDAAAANNTNYTTDFTYSGTVNGETVTSVFFVITGTGNSATAAAGSTYTVTPTNFLGFLTPPTGGNGFQFYNYNITYVPYNGTVGQAPLSITAASVNKTYGSSLNNPTTGSAAFTSSGLKNGQTIASVTINYTIGSAAGDAAGSYPGAVIPSLATGGTFNVSNYSVTYLNGNMTVSQATLTITASSVNKPFGTALTSGPASTGFTSSGLVNSETISTVYLTYSAGNNAADAIGTVGTISASLPITASGTFNTNNYNITFVPGVITVAAATFDWTGIVSTDWATPGNWSVGGVPQTSVYPGENEATDIVQIGVVAYSGNQPTVSATLPNAISSLTFGGAGTPITLTLAANVNFNASSSVTLNSGTEVVNLNGDNTSAFTLANYTSGSGSTFNVTGGGSINITATYANAGASNFGSGPVTMSGSFTNSGASTFGTGLLTFNSTTNQDFLTAKATASTVVFNNVLFTGGATYKFRTTPNGSGGNFELASAGVLNLSNNTTIIIANASFTLLSDANGSASIGQITDASKINGNVNVQRYMQAQRGYRLMASPVNGGTAGSNTVYSVNYLKNSTYLTGTSGTAGLFDKAGNPTLYLYREDIIANNNSFITGNYRGISDMSLGNSTPPSYSINIDGPGFNIPVSNGYLFYYRGSRNQKTLAQLTTAGAAATTDTLTASGTLNMGQYVFSDWYTPGSTALGYSNPDTTVLGFNLAGNPYASSIDWETYNTASPASGIYAQNLSDYVYELNPATSNYDVYEAGQGGKVYTNNATRTIVSGQGFFVLGNGTGAQLIFNESAKNTALQNTGPNLYMGKPAAMTAATQYLKLQMAMDNVNSDDVIIVFDNSAKSAFDLKEDAPYKIGSGKVSLASLSSDRRALAINRTPLNQKTVSIPLNVNSAASGTYSLNMNTLQGIPRLYDIWLMDAYKKDSLDMRDNMTYRFDLNKNDTTTYGAHRFTLVLRQNPALAYHLLNFSANKATGKQVQVTWTTEHEENYTNFAVERSTDGGKTFKLLGGVPSTGAGSYGFLDKNPGEINLYRLKQEDINNNITYSHIIPVSFSNLSNNLATNVINVFPNPASNEVNMTVSAAINTSAATYNYTITNSLGLLIRQGTSSQATWQTNVSDLTPGTYLIQIVNNKDKSFVGKSKFVKL